MEPRMSLITLGVSDLQRSFEFYHNGLELPTSGKVEDGIIFFKTAGTCLSIYPFDKLAEDISPDIEPIKPGYSGFTIAHNVKSKPQVQEVLTLAENAGGKIVKSAQDAFWGGYHGYFSDLDGYYWEVAYWDGWEFNPDGSLVIK